MSQVTRDLPQTLGALRQSDYSEERVSTRGVKDELRDNLICRLQKQEPLFTGIIGFEDSVIPQIVNAILSRHNFILLGLRGQAKTRLIRMMTDQDEVVAGENRSEEHTSELQSQSNLVCRLLLEKKK